MTALDHDNKRSEQSRAPIGIVCGGGALPIAVAAAAQRRGRSVFLLAIEGWADPRAVAPFAHCWVKLGRFGRVRRLAQAAGCREIVFLGAMLRPAISAIPLDFSTLRLLPRLYRLFRGGDDHLLSGLGRIFEEHGFQVLGAHEVAPEILVPEGQLGRFAPSPGDLDDALKGFALLDAIGPFDVGQAVVVADGRVLAVEAAEGTDALLARVAEMRATGRVRLAARAGVLVKAAKPQQDRRFDLPSIGPATVEAAQRAGLAGIFVRAGEAIMAEPQRLVASADAAELFVAGVAAKAVPRS